MATFTELTTRLAEYRAAESLILKSQEYSVGQGGAARKNRRADLVDVQNQITKLEAAIAAAPDNPANRGARRIRYFRPLG